MKLGPTRINYLLLRALKLKRNWNRTLRNDNFLSLLSLYRHGQITRSIIVCLSTSQGLSRLFYQINNDVDASITKITSPEMRDRKNEGINIVSDHKFRKIALFCQCPLHCKTMELLLSTNSLRWQSCETFEIARNCMKDSTQEWNILMWPLYVEHYNCPALHYR